MLKRLQSATAKDQTLQILKEYTIRVGRQNQIFDPSLMPYHQHHDEIVYNYDLLLKGQRIIIPTSMHSEIQTKIHQGHQGQDNCILRARHSVFWPRISHEIVELVSRCSECLTQHNCQQQETLLQHDIPDTPWTKVAYDLFTIYGKGYLLVVDYHSKYIEVAHLEKPADSSTVIRATKNIFSRHGIPKSVFTDNGPQFIANEYKQFATSWDFDHNDTSSPHFPQSNVLAERTVQTVKRTLKKAHKSGQDIHFALLVLNTTPSRDGLSPAFKMFNRNSRTTLPSAIPNNHRCIAKDPKPKNYHDKRVKDLPKLQPETVVRMRIDTDKSRKETGKIVEKCEQHRSYLVMNSKGNIVRHNRPHLLPTAEESHVHPNYDNLPCSSKTTHEQSIQPTSVKPASRVEQSQPPITVTRSGRTVCRPA